MQPSYGARLAPVPAREDHHVSTSLFDEPPERVSGRRHDGTPARRVRGTTVEALDEGEEVTQLGARECVAAFLDAVEGRLHLQDCVDVAAWSVTGTHRVHREVGGAKTVPLPRPL